MGARYEYSVQILQNWDSLGSLLAAKGAEGWILSTMNEWLGSVHLIYYREVPGVSP